MILLRQKLSVHDVSNADYPYKQIENIEIFVVVCTTSTFNASFCDFSAIVLNIMVVHGVYIVSKSGGLIFNHDHNVPKVDTEKVFNYPIDLKLDFDSKNVTVLFGQKDGINGMLFKLKFYFLIVSNYAKKIISY